VADDFDSALGDPAEGRFAAALAYRESPSCPTPSGIAPPGFSKPALDATFIEGRLMRPPWRENRILGP
jgi:hypothetical protein